MLQKGWHIPTPIIGRVGDNEAYIVIGTVTTDAYAWRKQRFSDESKKKKNE